MNQEKGSIEGERAADGTRVVVKELTNWVIHTTFAEDGSEIKRVGFPKRPIATAEELIVSAESDEFQEVS